MRIDRKYGATRFYGSDGRSFIAHKAPAGHWRITEMEDERPIGHYEADDMTETEAHEAARACAEDGFDYIIEPNGDALERRFALIELE